MQTSIDVCSIVSRLNLSVEHSMALINQLHYFTMTWPETAYLANQMANRIKCIVGDLSEVLSQLESGQKVAMPESFVAKLEQEHEKELDFDVIGYLTEAEGQEWREAEWINRAVVRIKAFVDNRQYVLMILAKDRQSGLREDRQ